MGSLSVKQYAYKYLIVVGWNLTYHFAAAYSYIMNATSMAVYLIGMGTNTKMIFEYSFCDIRIYSNIRFYTYLKLSYLSFLTLLIVYCTIRNIVLLINLTMLQEHEKY